MEEEERTIRKEKERKRRGSRNTHTHTHTHTHTRTPTPTHIHTHLPSGSSFTKYQHIEGRMAPFELQCRYEVKMALCIGPLPFLCVECLEVIQDWGDAGVLEAD